MSGKHPFKIRFVLRVPYCHLQREATLKRHRGGKVPWKGHWALLVGIRKLSIAASFGSKYFKAWSGKEQVKVMIGFTYKATQLSGFSDHNACVCVMLSSVPGALYHLGAPGPSVLSSFPLLLPLQLCSTRAALSSPAVPTAGPCCSAHTGTSCSREVCLWWPDWKPFLRDG